MGELRRGSCGAGGAVGELRCGSCGAGATLRTEPPAGKGTGGEGAARWDGARVPPAKGPHANFRDPGKPGARAATGLWKWNG